MTDSIKTNNRKYIMKAIETKYLSATDTRGTRIKATVGKLTATVPYDYALNDVDVAFEAVKELVRKHKLEWDISTMVYGGTDKGYIFCFPQSTIKANATLTRGRGFGVGNNA
jgi:hypothetical protein